MICGYRRTATGTEGTGFKLISALAGGRPLAPNSNFAGASSLLKSLVVPLAASGGILAPTDARRDAAFTGVQPQARNDADAFTEAEAHRCLVPPVCAID